MLKERDLHNRRERRHLPACAYEDLTGTIGILNEKTWGLYLGSKEERGWMPPEAIM